MKSIISLKVKLSSNNFARHGSVEKDGLNYLNLELILWVIQIKRFGDNFFTVPFKLSDEDSPKIMFSLQLGLRLALQKQGRRKHRGGGAAQHVEVLLSHTEREVDIFWRHEQGGWRKTFLPILKLIFFVNTGHFRYKEKRISNEMYNFFLKLVEFISY